MDMMQRMSQMMGTWGTGMMLLNLLTGLLLFGLLIVGIVAGVKWLLGQGPGGALTKEEFEAEKRDIA